MQITLKSLSITNFKGIESLKLEIRNHSTFVYGDNATGKTTILDSFLWLFFGKNSDGAAQFEIKRLDDRNKFIPKLESEVEAIILVDGKEISVKKCLRQKWVTRRGEREEKYGGDENVYFWNDVPLKESEFKPKVAGIIDEALFRMITNPLHFNSLKWEQRREMLVRMAGDISNDEVLDSIITVVNKSQFNGLIAALNQGKSIEEYGKEIGAKVKKIKGEAEFLPSRIDEATRSIIERPDFTSIRKQIETKQKALAKVQAQLDDVVSRINAANQERINALKAYNNQVNEQQQKVFGLKNQIQQLELNAKQQASVSAGVLKSKLDSLIRELESETAELNRYKSAKSNLEELLTTKESELQHLRDVYSDISAEKVQINDHEFTCPTCKQELPAESIENKKQTLTTNFNRYKSEKLEGLIKQADLEKAEIEKLNTRITNSADSIKSKEEAIASLNDEIANVKAELELPTQSIDETIASILSSDTNYMALVAELKAAELLKIEEPIHHVTSAEPSIADEKLKTERDIINNEIINLNKELAKEDQIKAAEARIAELKEQETKLADELMHLEGSEFAIMQFTKAKIDALERKINLRFKAVRFKMFKEQVNGGEAPCCETLVNSNGSFVPYADANHAAKINAGIDIINTLCKHYNVYAPIFIDNREAVTKLEDTESQVINLVVSEQDKKLRVA